MIRFDIIEELAYKDEDTDGVSVWNLFNTVHVLYRRFGNNESLDRTEPNPQKDEHLNGYI